MVRLLAQVMLVIIALILATPIMSVELGASDANNKQQVVGSFSKLPPPPPPPPPQPNGPSDQA